MAEGFILFQQKLSCIHYNDSQKMIQNLDILTRVILLCHQIRAPD